LKKFAIIIIFGIAGLIAYMNFDEVFYSEYWLQRRISGYSCIEPLYDIQEGTTQLKYKFYHEDGIDIEVALNDEGLVFISTGNWYANSGPIKNYNFRTNPKKTQRIIQNFEVQYSESENYAIDDHFSALHHTSELTNLATNERMLVGYYNYIPSEEFLELTSDIIELGNEVLNEL